MKKLLLLLLLSLAYIGSANTTKVELEKQNLEDNIKIFRNPILFNLIAGTDCLTVSFAAADKIVRSAQLIYADPNALKSEIQDSLNKTNQLINAISECIIVTIPNGAVLDLNHPRGWWECNDLYYRNKESTSCIRVPANAKKSGISDFKCNSNYTRKYSYCTRTNSPKKSNKTNNRQSILIENCKYVGKQITKLGFGFSNSDIGEPFEFGGVACGKHYGRFISIVSMKPPRAFVGGYEDIFGSGTCIDFQSLKYWQVDEGKDCR